LLLSTPLFYLLTKHFYAEDLIDVIEAVEAGKPIPADDLEKDIMVGVMIQFVVIAGVLGISMTLMLRLISQRMWRPFDDTLQHIEIFTLEEGKVPEFAGSDVKEFQRLNNALTQLIKNNLSSYRTQKEFTENASHELQTPIAIFQSKLDLLLQSDEITEEQSNIIQSLYSVSSRLSRLNKNLLLLAKIENNQFEQIEQIDVVEVVNRILMMFDGITERIKVNILIKPEKMMIKANKILLESLIGNLLTNAIRHNIENGEITLMLEKSHLIISNTSNEEELKEDTLFIRFHRSLKHVKGNGLGLSIIKAICDYHKWLIQYRYNEGIHSFIVKFN
jgi:Signal transduction histidine kinase